MKTATLKRLCARMRPESVTADPEVLWDAIRRLHDHGKLDTYDVIVLGSWLNVNRRKW